MPDAACADAQFRRHLYAYRVNGLTAENAGMTFLAPFGMALFYAPMMVPFALVSGVLSYLLSRMMNHVL
jgi:hypothetical protein